MKKMIACLILFCCFSIYAEEPKIVVTFVSEMTNKTLAKNVPYFDLSRYDDNEIISCFVDVEDQNFDCMKYTALKSKYTYYATGQTTKMGYSFLITSYNLLLLASKNKVSSFCFVLSNKDKSQFIQKNIQIKTKK